MDIVQLKNIKKQYDDRVIFQNVNINIQSGSFVAIKGDSGSGKSTLLNLIGGLELPTNGQIIVDGEDVNKLGSRQRSDFYRHKVGIIFQGSYLQPQLSLYENIILPGIFAKMPKSERKSRAEQLSKTLGIFNNLKCLPKEVSGGQAERACIARALLLNPKIILADEPTSNLDKTNAKNVLALLNNIRSQMGVTIIVSSHDQGVLEFATQTITIADGVIYDDKRNI